MAKTLYDCDVRIGGDIGNVVPKSGIPAAEILLLRSIHGNDSVVNLSAIKRLSREALVKRMGIEFDMSSDGGVYDYLMVVYEKSSAKVIKLFGERDNPNVPDELNERTVGPIENRLEPVKGMASENKVVKGIPDDVLNLRAECEKLGIKYHPNNKAETLQALIDKHKEQESADDAEAWADTGSGDDAKDAEE